MNQEVATLRPNEYTSNNTIRKSEKVLNYPPNFHLKTQHQDRHDEEHRSPEQERPQFRETTWRKPRMPYNKFPDAFQMRQKGKSIDKVLPDDYDKLLKQRQYEQVKKYLNPISLEKRPENSRQEPDSSNPLAAYKRYLEMQKKFTREFENDTLDPVRKSKPLSLKKPAPPGYRISDCITLQVVKRGHNTGTIKKMLHVPTLKLLCVREEPTNTRESRNCIKEWVNFWQRKLEREETTLPFLRIHSVAYNYPEGAISILIDYFQEGSLLDLLEAVLTLPESVIREVFEQVMEALRLYYDFTQMQFGGLSPSQILLSSDGSIRLGMGLYYHFTNSTSNSIYQLKTPQKTNIFEMSMTQKNFMKGSISQPANLETERALDIFKLGLIMLECAIGGFENYEQSEQLHDILKLVFTEDGQRIVERDHLCCLLHSENYLIEWANRRQDRTKWETLDPAKLIPYMKILKDRFSVHLVGFLCQALKLQHSRRARLHELMEHSFFRSDDKDCRTVSLRLRELMVLRSGEQEAFIESVKLERMDKFISHVLQVLSSCSREQVVGLLRTEKDKILGIGKYIGLNYYAIGEKLYEAISALAKGMREST